MHVWPRYVACYRSLSDNIAHERTNRGKALGGSSAINFMAYMTPPADDLNGEIFLQSTDNQELTPPNAT